MKYIIGIDEVGRGALAGPVVVAAAQITSGMSLSLCHSREGRNPSFFRNLKLGKLRDSKKLSLKQREAWFAYFKDHPDISYAVAFVYPRQIEKRNISSAANLAALRACSRLTSSPSGGRVGRGLGNLSDIKTPSARNGLLPLKREKVQVFLDGGLFLGSKKGNPSTREALAQGIKIETVIKGDEKIPAISIASIIAKVIRDRAMIRFARHYPEYGFEIHKGYGTLAHRKALKKHGPSVIHRKTFLKGI